VTGTDKTACLIGSCHLFRSLCAYGGDRESYRRHAEDLFQRYGRGRELASVEPVVKICLILPEPAVDLQQLLAASDLLVAGPAGDANPWHPFVKGLVEYRAGRYESALRWLEKARQLQKGNALHFFVMCHLVRAPTHHGLGHNDATRAALREAAEAQARRASREGDDWSEHWQAWVICQVLSREAKALLDGGETGPDK
jgi:hypothetical protein